jgi:hypothetical protein
MLAETLKFTTVHKAVAASVARSTKDEKLRALIREEQDLGMLSNNLSKAIESIESSASENQSVLERLREKLATPKKNVTKGCKLFKSSSLPMPIS